MRSDRSIRNLRAPVLVPGCRSRSPPPASQVLGLVLMTTAIVYGTEQASKHDSFNEPGWKWHDALYYTVVTLTTVG